MSNAHRSFLATAMGLALLAGAAQAKVSGYCEHEGRRVAMIDGAAWGLPVDDDDRDEDEAPAGPEIKLVFATFTLDTGALARAGDRDDAFSEQSWQQEEAARLELTVQDATVGQQYLWMSPGTNLSYSSNEVGHYTAGRVSVGRMVGKYRFSPEDGQELACDIDFDVAMLGDAADAPPPPGVALPAGGGEAGRVYLALNAAMRAGDLDAMAKLLPPEHAAELAKARTTPDFKAQLAMMQALAPEDVVITGGRQDGDRAWLEFTAQEAGEPRAGTAEMKRANGRWQLVHESTRTPN